ncbi:50S ribosomal protein L13 [Candidatus Wolfebacteria bacterium RIFCSPHIGHO2_01_FULL_48_22]|uniref:50S ribosomal protein L13 n=2 Tax=Candidatus Wolfeibacteriota TaxID=1752735 RepID=A0A1F8DTR4_9BACT|nr:MAG: 50S ribosomal protein L13 [Candidatus Wolfebacteria bacterium RIFCSPHIGHO2_01_FULL_48_22]OGM92276.1 MAG: 50S ribosomal protein L13 [Candidatus Wolfebacteria bacterium RIFCSPLOWO2_01_FULL_47_17b]
MEYTIDCKNKRLGRVASEIATILQGKKEPEYDPRLEGVDTVVVQNVDKIELSGSKLEQKKYYSHTTQIGHLKERKLQDVIAKHGKKYVLRHAVLRMLPKNKLQAKRIKRMKFA